jgi:hypothetical protein
MVICPSMVVKGAREQKVFEMKLQKKKKIQSQQLPLSKTALMHGLAWAEAPGPTPIGGPIISQEKRGPVAP